MEHDLSEPLILGRSWLAEIYAIASPAHQCIKFKFQGEVITVKADHETNLAMIWMPYPIEFQEPSPYKSGTLPIGEYWDDEATSIQGFQHLVGGQVTQGYA